MSLRPTTLACSWSRQIIGALSEADRHRYEQACDQVDKALVAKGLPDQDAENSSLSLELQVLVALYIGKCRLDALGGGADDNALERLLAELSPIGRVYDAVEELRAYAALIACEIALPGSNSGFLLPPSHELVSKLSAGGHSRTYLVKRKSLGRLECLKVVPKLLTRHSSVSRRLAEESFRAAQMSHPGLVRVYDAGSTGACHFMFMEYVSGGTLRDRLKTGRLPWQEAVHLLCPVASALHCLHVDARIAHGDMKPDNLLVGKSPTGQEELKITDFGLARCLDESAAPTADRLILGTPGYIAPELYLQQRDPSNSPAVNWRAVDVFALGVTLYELLTGVPPSAEPPGAAAAAATSSSVGIVGDIPELVAYVVRRACAADPRDRYASALELAQALEKCCMMAVTSRAGSVVRSPSDLPSSAQPHGAMPPAAGRRRSRSFQICLVLLLGIAAYTLSVNDRAAADEPPRRTIDRLAPVSSGDVTASVVLRGRRATQAGEGLLAINEDWMRAVGASRGFEQVAMRMRSLIDGAASAVMRDPLWREHEELAPVAPYLDTNRYPHLLGALGAGGDFLTLSNLLVINPYPKAIALALPSWERNQKSLAHLMRLGLFGSDSILGDASDTLLDEWVAGVLAECSVDDPARSSEWACLLFEQHQAVRDQLASSEGRAAFPEAWSRFRRIARKEPDLAREMAMDDRVWAVLQMPEGEPLLERYRLLSVDIFAGESAIPSDPQLLRAASTYLLSGYAPVVRLLSDAAVRTDEDFAHLLRLELSSDQFAQACQEIEVNRSSGRHLATLSSLARKSRPHLLADLSRRDVDRWPIEKLLPQLVYLRLGIKVAQGKSIYDVEKQSLVKQAVSDVVTFGLARFGSRMGMSEVQVNGAIAVVPFATDLGAQTLWGPSSPEESSTPGDKEPDERLRHRQARQSALRENVQACIRQTCSDGQTRMLDITNAMSVLRELSRAPSSSAPSVDLAKVRFFRHQSGRVFAVPTAAEGLLASPTIVAFFQERTQILCDPGALADSKDLALDQLISAWMLLAAADQLPSSHR